MDKKIALATFWAEGIRFEVELRRYDDGRLALSGMADGAAGQVQDEIADQVGSGDEDVTTILDAWEAYHLKQAPDSVFDSVAAAIGRLQGRRIGSAPDVDEAPDIGGNFIDSRDVIKRLEIYREAAKLIGIPEDQLDSFDLGENYPANMPEDLTGDDTEILEEFLKLRELNYQGESYASDWNYGATLIAVEHFTEYAQDLAEDIGAINADAPWPANRIDWEAAAEDLKIDYTEISYDGNDYLVR